MTDQVLIVIFAIIIIGLLAGIFLYIYFRGVRDDILEYWNKILDKTRIRLDMFPQLLDSLKRLQAIDETKFQEIIALRAKLWPMEEVSTTKVSTELTLTEFLHDAKEKGKKNSSLLHDTNFLYITQEMTRLGSEIDEMGEEYNMKVRKYNHKILLVKPILGFLGLGKLMFFEFEA